MAKSLEQWKNQVWNKTIDLDNQSFDCVDVSKSWITYLTDKPWQECAGWGNAKDIYSFWSATYLDRVPVGNVPRVGDIVVMNGQVGGGYGHTGVVVGVSGQNITIYQQNTFTQQPVYTGVFNGYVSYVTGYLRPNGNAPFTVGADVPLAGYQRVTVNDTVNYRDAPARSGNIMQTFDPNTACDFKGWVRGEAVDGNNIWFVGRYTGGYAWSGAFTDTSTHDLVDLNVKPEPLKDFQRVVGNSVVNYRREPVIMPDNVIRTFNPGEILDFDAWTRSTAVDGNDVWFRGRHTGGWAHSGGFTNQTTTGLVEVATVVSPVPVTPTYPVATIDPEVTKVYNKKHPLPKDYVPADLENNGGQQLRKEANASMRLMQSQQALVMASGYRSYATQEAIYAQNVKELGQAAADRVSARAGYSEHQTGLTMDFGPIDEAFDKTAAYTWLTENAYKYGWVLRYPASAEAATGYSYEPWHWRYVGVTVAADMRAKGIATLEEYSNIDGGDYPKQTEPTEPAEPTDPESPVNNSLFKILQALVKFLSDIVNLLKRK